MGISGIWRSPRTALRRAATVAALSLLVWTPVSAASFDCANAATDVERMICSDPQISQMDEQLSALYAAKVAESPYYRQSQRDWVATRDACQDRECVLGLYVRRINFLLPANEQISFVPPPSITEGNSPPAPAYPTQVDAESVLEEGDVSPNPHHVGVQESMEDPTARSPMPGAAVGADIAPHEAIASPPAAEQIPRGAGRKDSGPAKLFYLAVLAIALGAIAIFALSMKGKIVFYYDGRDFAWSLSPAIVAVVTGLVVWIFHEGGDAGQLTLVQICVIGLGSCVAAFGIWVAVYNAIRYNRSLPIGLLIGVCKTMISGLMVFSLFANAGRKNGRDYYKNTATGRRERAAAATSFAILGILWMALVNGERVYEKKGWELPAD